MKILSSITLLLLFGLSLFSQNSEYPYFLNMPEADLIGKMDSTIYEIGYTDDGNKYYYIKGIVDGNGMDQIIYISKSKVLSYVISFQGDLGEMAINSFVQKYREEGIEVSHKEWRMYKSMGVIQIILGRSDDGRRYLMHVLMKE